MSSIRKHHFVSVLMYVSSIWKCCFVSGRQLLLAYYARNMSYLHVLVFTINTPALLPRHTIICFYTSIPVNSITDVLLFPGKAHQPTQNVSVKQNTTKNKLLNKTPPRSSAELGIQERWRTNKSGGAGKARGRLVCVAQLGVAAVVA